MKTILFAAGASIPFFNPQLSTSYLTGQVKDINNWNRVISQFNNTMGNNIVVVPSAFIQRILTLINNFAPNANFEEIAEIVDKLSSYAIDPIPTNAMMNLFERVLLDLLNNQNVRLPAGMDYIPYLFREIIAQGVLNLENHHKVHNYNTLINEQHDFINFITENDDQVNLISLNYDDCVLNSLNGLGFENGFMPTRNQYNYQLDINTFFGANKVVYCKQSVTPVLYA